jgi:hypothetical protein
MDPESNLKEQIALAKSILKTMDEAGDASFSESVAIANDVADDAVALAELVMALDEWISRGGFLPRKWEKGRR